VRILLTNHMLEGLGGTQKWTHDMARELHRSHDVEVFTFIKGHTSDKIEEFCPVITAVNSHYDLVMSNHGPCLTVVQDKGDVVIHTSHGPAHGLERPYPGATQYVGVSEEVRQAYDPPMEVITNGVNLLQFKPFEKDWEGVRVASLCKNAGASHMLQDACGELGYAYEWVHYTAKPTWDVANLMRKSDVVVGCGRTAIEGLACGKMVLVFDGREDEPRADGWITEDNVEELRYRNFSCRTKHEFWDLPNLIEALSHLPGNGWQRAWAEKNADIRMKAARYIALYNHHKEFKHGTSSEAHH